MPAPHHGKAVGMVEHPAGLDRHGLFAGIDQVPILGPRQRCPAKTRNAVFGVKDGRASRRLKAANHHRRAVEGARNGGCKVGQGHVHLLGPFSAGC